MTAETRPAPAENSFRARASALSSCRWQRVIHLLLLALGPLQLQAEAAVSCPTGCTCDPSGLLSSCVGFIPRDLSPSIRTLKVTNLELTKVASSTFKGLENLEQLHLTDGRLSEISEDTFSSLYRLRKLNLSNNELNIIPRNAFSKSPKLLQLDLSRNPVVLPGWGPILFSSSLSVLDLSSCSLSRLPERAFSALPALSELYMRGNAGLKSISTCVFQPLQSFMILDVDSQVDLNAKCRSEDEDAVEGEQRPTPPDDQLKTSPPGDVLTYKNIAYICLMSSIVVVSLTAGFCMAFMWMRRRNAGVPPVIIEEGGYVWPEGSHLVTHQLLQQRDYDRKRSSAYFKNSFCGSYESIRQPFYDRNKSQHFINDARSLCDVPSVHHQV